MLEPIQRLRDSITGVYLGQPEIVERVLRCMVARGHLLIEDVPGVGKTLLASAIAKSLGCSFSRIQLTPDMLPADVLGVTIYDRDGSRFQFNKGPIFANIVLADEVNRTTPRTQSAMLEAMSDASVSIDGTTHTLEQPFLVIATQNPYEFEGTYPLPENQLDRFLMRLSLGYPDAASEAELLDLRPTLTRLEDLPAVMSGQELIDAQRACDAVTMAPAVRDYVVRFATATRESPEVEVGLSPRGSLALAQAARATALIDGRDFATPADVYDNIIAVCAHRVITPRHNGPGAWQHAADTLEAIIKTVESPD